MKRKMFKAVCIVMSVIMLLASLTTGSFALDGTKVNVPGFVGYSAYAVYENRSGTIALVDFYNEDTEDTKYAYTKNGTEFKEINFDGFVEKYKQDMDDYSIDNLYIKGDKFVFLINTYAYGEYDSDIQDYTFDILSTDFVATEDFETFKQYEFQGLMGDDIYYSPDEYSFRSFFGYVNGKWVYANTDWKLTSVSDTAANGKEVYYISDDLSNWTPCYLVDEPLYDATSYYSAIFSVEGDKLIVNRIRFIDDPNIYAYVQKTYVIDSDFNNWTTTYNIRNSTDITEAVYCSPTNSNDYIYAFEVVNVDALNIGYQQAYSQLVKIDLKTAQRTVVSKTQEDYSTYQGARIGDTNYLLEFDIDQRIHLNYVKNDGSVNPIKLDGSDVLEDCYGVGERLYAFEKGFMWIVEDNDSRKYDVSSVMTDDVTGTMPFMLNHNIFLLQSLEDGCVAVYDTQIKHSKLGDINLDDKFSSSDALMALQSATGLVELDENETYSADINKDGNVNSNDALLILQRATGLIEQF